jgi:hypothetical protein
MCKSPLDYYLLDTPDLLIEEALDFRAFFLKSLYDKGIFYGCCCALTKFYRQIAAFDFTEKLSLRCRNFDPEKLASDLQLPSCSQGNVRSISSPGTQHSLSPMSDSKSKSNFLFSVLSELLCDAIDLRDQAIREQNPLQDDWIRGQYFGHYSVITTLMNQVIAFELFDMLPNSWHEFDPDTLHNGIKKSDLGLL